MGQALGDLLSGFLFSREHLLADLVYTDGVLLTFRLKGGRPMLALILVRSSLGLVAG